MVCGVVEHCLEVFGVDEKHIVIIGDLENHGEDIGLGII